VVVQVVPYSGRLEINKWTSWNGVDFTGGLHSRHSTRSSRALPSTTCVRVLDMHNGAGLSHPIASPLCVCASPTHRLGLVTLQQPVRYRLRNVARCLP
jgi:hypothetical protein